MSIGRHLLTAEGNNFRAEEEIPSKSALMMVLTQIINYCASYFVHFFRIFLDVVQ